MADFTTEYSRAFDNDDTKPTIETAQGSLKMKKFSDLEQIP